MSDLHRGAPWRAGAAFAAANARYWLTVWPTVRAELGRWRQRAQEIPDAHAREAALRKLAGERFNCEAAAAMATIAPARRRMAVTEAIVALQVAYDFLDLLDERSPTGMQPLIDSVAGGPVNARGGYLDELAATVRSRLATLPATGAVREAALRSARRCAEAQQRSHAAARHGAEQELRQWAIGEAEHGALGWRELLAGSTASVLCMHALIAAAADPATTAERGDRLESLYLSIGALTMLDSLLDRDEDRDAGEPGYLGRYESPAEMGRRLAAVAREAAGAAAAMEHGGHHLTILAGVVAYYASATHSPAMAQATAPLRRELGPLLSGPLAVLRAWRLARKVAKSGFRAIVSKGRKSEPACPQERCREGRKIGAWVGHARPLGGEDR